MNSRTEKTLAPGTAAIPKPIAPETDDSAQRNREVLSTRAEPHTAPAQLSPEPRGGTRPTGAHSALARGMIANLCAGNIDQAKRMLGMEELTLAKVHLTRAIKQIEEIEAL